MKRNFKSLFVTLLLALPLAVQAQFTYITNADDTIAITGYTGSDGDVSIPDTINGLSVTSIGGLAFWANSTLTNVTIPDSVTIIGDRAFTGTALICISIPNSITNIGEDVFADCLNLTAIMVDAQNPSYRSVDGVLFNKGQTTLIQYPGNGILNSYMIPDGVISIRDDAFIGCFSLNGVTIPNSVISVGDDAFMYCYNLTNVLIGTNVASIGSDAFYDCFSLIDVTIPGSVTNIGNDSFFACLNLKAITVSTQNTVYSSMNGVLFNKSQSRLIQYPGGNATTSYTIPESVTEMGAYAFANSDLTSITIPDSVSIIGGTAFWGCNNFMAISVSAQNPIYSSVNGVLFDKNHTTLILFPCGKSGSYTIPDGVTGIVAYAFAYCERLASVTIPGSVNNIEVGTFWACTNLASVYFTGNAPYMVDQDAFNGFETPNQIVPYDPATLYYLPGALGWSGFAVNNFILTPTALWLPQVQTDDGSFGVKNNQFGCNISWASGQTVVVEACTNLVNPVWKPVQTFTLTNGSTYFSDPQSANLPGRFYRLRSP